MGGGRSEEALLTLCWRAAKLLGSLEELWRVGFLGKESRSGCVEYMAHHNASVPEMSRGGMVV